MHSRNHPRSRSPVRIDTARTLTPSGQAKLDSPFLMHHGSSSTSFLRRSSYYVDEATISPRTCVWLSHSFISTFRVLVVNHVSSPQLEEYCAQGIAVPLPKLFTQGPTTSSNARSTDPVLDLSNLEHHADVVSPFSHPLLSWSFELLFSGIRPVCSPRSRPFPLSTLRTSLNPMK